MSGYVQRLRAAYQRSRDRSPYPDSVPRPSHTQHPVAAVPAPQTRSKVYRRAGEFKRDVERMARDGWQVQSQSSVRMGGFTKTLVVYTRQPGGAGWPT